MIAGVVSYMLLPLYIFLTLTSCTSYSASCNTSRKVFSEVTAVVARDSAVLRENHGGRFQERGQKLHPSLHIKWCGLFTNRNAHSRHVGGKLKIRRSGRHLSGMVKVKVKLSLSTPRTHITGEDMEFHTFLTSELDGGERSASRPGHFTPRAGLDVFEKRKIPYCCRDSNTGPSSL